MTFEVKAGERAQELCSWAFGFPDGSCFWGDRGSHDVADQALTLSFLHYQSREVTLSVIGEMKTMCDFRIPVPQP